MGLLNIDGYFDGLLNFFDHAVNEKFIRDEHRKNIVV
jgi:predicted Rossmann-fold nucleotide-binding protein